MRKQPARRVRQNYAYVCGAFDGVAEKPSAYSDSSSTAIRLSSIIPYWWHPEGLELHASGDMSQKLTGDGSSSRNDGSP